MTLNIILIIAVILVTALLLFSHQHSSRRESGLKDSISALNSELANKKIELSAVSSINETKLKDSADKIKSLEDEIVRLNEELISVREHNASLSTRLKIVDENKEKLEEIHRQNEKVAEERFKNLANQILKQNTSDLKAQSEERLREILNPLKENIEEFKKTVSDTYNNEARERFSLSERIRELVSLNQSLSQQAKDLSEALRNDSKIQGNWGEMILESILERSGLIKGEEYFVQVTRDAMGSLLRNDEGDVIQPDVVVKYPDDRYVVIDSKVSLTAFVEYSNAETEEKRESGAKRHIMSVRRHIDELSRKNYQDYNPSDNSARLDFVMMFIPNEPAYIAAMRLEPTLWQEAYDKHILIVSPTHLISALRLISQLWSRDRQTKNAILIAEEAAKMYDKFADFTHDMEKIEKGLSSTRKSFDEAMKKLSTGTGNLINRAGKLQELGVRAKKQISSSAARQSEIE